MSASTSTPESSKSSRYYQTVKELAKEFPELNEPDWKTKDIEDYISSRFGYVFSGHDYVSREYSDIKAYYNYELESSTVLKEEY